MGDRTDVVPLGTNGRDVWKGIVVGTPDICRQLIRIKGEVGVERLHRLIQVSQVGQVQSMGSDVGHLKHGVFHDLAFYVEVPFLDVSGGIIHEEGAGPAAGISQRGIGQGRGESLRQYHRGRGRGTVAPESAGFRKAQWD